MRYQISIYNDFTHQKTIRYIMDIQRVKAVSEKLWKEIELEAHSVVLIEPVK